MFYITQNNYKMLFIRRVSFHLFAVPAMQKSKIKRIFRDEKCGFNLFILIVSPIFNDKNYLNKYSKSIKLSEKKEYIIINKNQIDLMY